jgi:four helix bundle protein
MNYHQTEPGNKNRCCMKLIVWQKAMQLFKLVWKIAFVESKIDFKLRLQVADAAQPVSANISEGYGRRFVSEYIQFLYYALGSMAETMARAIGLKQTGQISLQRFRDLHLLHYQVENRLLKLTEKLEQKRDDRDWVARIAEDPEEYDITPPLRQSITPSIHHSVIPVLRADA